LSQLAYLALIGLACALQATAFKLQVGFLAGQLSLAQGQLVPLAAYLLPLFPQRVTKHFQKAVHRSLTFLPPPIQIHQFFLFFKGGLKLAVLGPSAGQLCFQFDDDLVELLCHGLEVFELGLVCPQRDVFFGVLVVGEQQGCDVLSGYLFHLTVHE
jgi:hypothetical protein